MNGVPRLAPPSASVFEVSDTSVSPWRQFALCLGHDPDLWYPVEADGGAEAVGICAQCPVRPDCLDWALEHNEREGIWGGTSPRRRQMMRSDARRHRGKIPVHS